MSGEEQQKGAERRESMRASLPAWVGCLAYTRCLRAGQRARLAGILPEGVEEIDVSYCSVCPTRSAIRN